MNKGLISFALNRENQRQQDEALKFCLSFSDFLSYPINSLNQSVRFLKSLLSNENTHQRQILLLDPTLFELFRENPLRVKRLGQNKHAAGLPIEPVHETKFAFVFQPGGDGLLQARLALSIWNRQDTGRLVDDKKLIVLEQ